MTPTKVYTWAKGMPGLLPVLLENLLGARKAAKKLMGKAANAKADALELMKKAQEEHNKEEEQRQKELFEKAEAEEAVYNGRQLALKISANSIYGFTGAVKTGKYRCLAVADCTTYRAREMLHATVEYVKEFCSTVKGINCDVVYGDTDSVMVLFEGIHTKEEAFDLGDEAAEWITDKFPEHIILEMEKVYFPWILMRKKRYAGLMFCRNKRGEVVFDHLDAKGIELIRRDNCELAKMVQKDVINALLYDIDPPKACASLHNHLQKIVDNEYERNLYEISKSRRKSYKNWELPHLKVVDLMESRNKGSAPQVGDRVPYVLVETKNIKAKTFEKAEDPVYAAQHNVPIDRLYYVEHQIVKPIVGLLKFVNEVSDPEGMFSDHIRILSQQRNKQSSIMSFLNSSVKTTPTSMEDTLKVMQKPAMKKNNKRKQETANTGQRNVKDFFK